MSRRRIGVALLFVAALSPASAAQLTAAQALKQFKGAHADLLGNTKSEMNGAKAEFFVALAEFEAVLKAGTYTTGDAETLFEALQTLMGDLGAVTRSAGNELASAAGDALDGFADGAALNGIFPTGFYPGNGAPIDTYRAAILMAQDKTIAAVAKRLAKTRKLAEKQANVGLSVTLAAPGVVRDHSFKEGGGFSLGNQTPITVDILLAVSDLAQTSDGVVFLGGSGGAGLGAVAVVLAGPDAFSGSGGVPILTVHRWGLVVDGGAGIPEGVYIASATQGTDGPLAFGQIGVR